MQNHKFKGDNFTREYKYPIKIYRVGQIEFSNGVEVRKIIVAGIVIVLMLVLFTMFGGSTNQGALSFVFKNWLVILVCVPAVITFVVFSMKYDHKPIIPFLKDRIKFYKSKNKAFEHFQAVPLNQFEKELQFEVVKHEKGEE